MSAIRTGDSSPEHPKKALFIVAHQDDEVFIVSRIKKHLMEGDQAFVIWTAASYQKDESFKKTRLEESKALMRTLGIPADQFCFLMYPDGSTYQHISKIVVDLTVHLDKIRPDIIYIPAYEGGHIDHDTAHYCLVQAVESTGIPTTVYEFPEYSGHGTPWGLLPLRMRRYPDSLKTECRALSEEEYSFVLEAWQLFKSQHFPLNLFIRLTAGHRRTFGIEYIRPLPDYNYLERPPTKKVAYEKYLDCCYDDFQQGIQAYLKQRSDNLQTMRH